MTKALFKEAIIKVVAGIVVVAALLFIPAGTVHYWNAWLFMALLFIPMIAAGFVLMAKNPALLKKRLNAKEKEGAQQQVVVMSGIMFIAAFITAGLNYRYSWMEMHVGFTVFGTVAFLLGYIMYAEVIRENDYLSRVIEVQDDQKVIDTGLYAVIRHPMYTATVLLFISIGFILGSPASIIILLAYIPIIAKRIKYEEKFLESELAGYTEYKDKVKYKLIPLIW